MTTPSITFAQAVADWLIALENRNKKLSPNTLTTFRSRVKRLLSVIGSEPLERVSSGVVKKVVASVADHEGLQIFPRRWNNKFLGHLQSFWNEWRGRRDSNPRPLP